MPTRSPSAAHSQPGEAFAAAAGLPVLSGGGAAFARWLKGHPNVTLSTERLDCAHGWSGKPYAFLRLLELGYEDVLWIDSDIIVTGDITGLLARLDRNVVCVIEESLWGQDRDREHTLWRRHGDSSSLRAALWKL